MQTTGTAKTTFGGERFEGIMALLSLSVINIKPQIDRSWGRLASLRGVGRQINDMEYFFICSSTYTSNTSSIGAVYTLTTNVQIIYGPSPKDNREKASIV